MLFYNIPRKRGKEIRDNDHTVTLHQREYGRKLQDVNCLLGKVGEEQKRLSDNKIHVENQAVNYNNDIKVQVFLGMYVEGIIRSNVSFSYWFELNGNITRLSLMELKT